MSINGGISHETMKALEVLIGDKPTDYSNLEAIIPVSYKGDNSTKIITTDGNVEIIAESIGKFTQIMYKNYGLDKKAEQAWVRRIIGKKNNVPIVIHDNLVFLGVKLYQEDSNSKKNKDDKSDKHYKRYAYIRTTAIKSVVGDTITLNSGHEIRIGSTESDYIADKAREARCVVIAYLQERKQGDYKMVEKIN